VKRSPPANRKASVARERLRKSYRPEQVRILFVGEAPPASGRFFYKADSGLYRAIRETFIAAIPALRDADFRESFRSLGCYLVDLCGRPVDRLGASRRRQVCMEGEVILSRTLQKLRPLILITVVRSITGNVSRARQKSNWKGLHIELPYPGRWQTHKVAFRLGLVPILRKEFRGE
jgi:hypothetical protein